MFCSLSFNQYGIISIKMYLKFDKLTMLWFLSGRYTVCIKLCMLYTYKISIVQNMKKGVNVLFLSIIFVIKNLECDPIISTYPADGLHCLIA